MYSDVLALVRTNYDKELLLEEIASLKRSQYEMSMDFDKALSSSVRASVAQAIKKGLQSGVSIEEYLNGLDNALDKLTEVKMTLAIEPTEDFFIQIYDWLIATVGAGHILEVNIDKRILGGAQISYKGKYIDYSLDKILHETMES